MTVIATAAVAAARGSDSRKTKGRRFRLRRGFEPDAEFDAEADAELEVDVESESEPGSRLAPQCVQVVSSRSNPAGIQLACWQRLQVMTPGSNMGRNVRS